MFLHMHLFLSGGNRLRHTAVLLTPRKGTEGYAVGASRLGHELNRTVRRCGVPHPESVFSSHPAHLHAGQVKPAHSATLRPHHDAGQTSARPLRIKREAAVRPQSAETAVRPLLGESGKEPHPAHAVLQKHLGYRLAYQQTMVYQSKRAMWKANPDK